ncbi:MAG: ABC transporter permease [Thaumarchaeota archaeon]|nr:ABC transporter permease [Nitrososphaerota archaeon]
MSNDQPHAANTVPGSLVQVGVTMKYTLLDYLRSRRFVIMLAIVLIISALLTVLVAYYRPGSMVGSGATTIDFYSTWWGTFASFLTVISGIFFGGDGIAAEFQNKTGYFTVPNPIRRSSIYIGKFLASFTAATVVLVVYLAIAVANGLFYFGANIPSQFGESFLFAWFYLLAVLGFTFMFSSLFKTSSYAILVSFLLLIVGFSLISALIEGLTNTEPWYILSYGASIIMDVFTSPYPTTITRAGFTTYVASIPEGLAIMAAYFIVSSMLGLILFERKEFN